MIFKELVLALNVESSPGLRQHRWLSDRYENQACHTSTGNSFILFRCKQCVITSVSFWTYLLVSQAQAMFIDCNLKAIVLNGWWISLYVMTHHTRNTLQASSDVKCSCSQVPQAPCKDQFCDRKDI